MGQVLLIAEYVARSRSHWRRALLPALTSKPVALHDGQALLTGVLQIALLPALFWVAVAQIWFGKR